MECDSTLPPNNPIAMTHASNKVYHDHHWTRHGDRVNDLKKGGSGKGNWGSLEDEIAMHEHYHPKEKKPSMHVKNEPASNSDKSDISNNSNSIINNREKGNNERRGKR